VNQVTSSPPLQKDRPVEGAGPFGLAIFLVSLGVLFVAGLIGYWVVRSMNPGWGEGLPGMPVALWVSTALLVASSVTMHMALNKAKAGADPSALGSAMALTTGLGALFLLGQVVGWWVLVGTLSAAGSLYGFLFYVLTTLHAVHVIAGLIPLAVTTRRAYAGVYSAEQHDGVLMCTMYWHFLDVVWVVVFLSLLA